MKFTTLTFILLLLAPLNVRAVTLSSQTNTNISHELPTGGNAYNVTNLSALRAVTNQWCGDQAYEQDNGQLWLFRCATPVPNQTPASGSGSWVPFDLKGTYTPTFTSTFTITPTPTNTPTFTISYTFTRTPTNTFTLTKTSTLTNTFSPTNTFTPIMTPTFTGTLSPTAWLSFTPTFTRTPTFTPTITLTSTITFTYTNTSSPTVTRTFTSTSSPTSTGSATPTPTLTNSPTCASSWTPGCGNQFTVTSTATVMPTSTQIVGDTVVIVGKDINYLNSALSSTPYIHGSRALFSTSAPHGFTSGDLINLIVNSSPAVQGSFPIVNTTATTFDVQLNSTSYSGSLQLVFYFNAKRSKNLQLVNLDTSSGGGVYIFDFAGTQPDAYSITGTGSCVDVTPPMGGNGYGWVNTSTVSTSSIGTICIDSGDFSTNRPDAYYSFTIQGVK